MKVVYFQRKPSAGTFSVERYFDMVRSHLPASVTPVVSRARFLSIGLWRRFANLIGAANNQGDINHVAGDIHYVTYLLRKKRTVLTVLDCGFERSSSGLKRFLLRWLWFRIPEKRAAAVTAISHFSKERFIAHTDCAESKVHVIYVSVSDVFRPVPRQFNATCPTILHVGTTENKNLERLCAALDGISCRLHVIGRLSEGQLSALARVNYTNSAGLSENQLWQAYADSDMLAFVSTYEGFGIPIVEANLVGRPVVTSNVTSMPEIAGNAACLVDPFDVESIREGIRRVIDDAAFRDAIVRKGFVNAKRFDPQVIANQYAELYRAVLNGAQNGRQ